LLQGRGGLNPRDHRCGLPECALRGVLRVVAVVRRPAAERRREPELTAPGVFTAVSKAAYPIALVLPVTDLACLVLDLGDPLRFHDVLRVFKPTSPMSLGTWSLTIYSLPLTVAAAASVLPSGWLNLEGVRKAAVVLGSCLPSDRLFTRGFS